MPRIARERGEKLPTSGRTKDEILQGLLEFAKEAGATEARGIDADTIVVDNRVRLKCSVPRCSSYNSHLLCPPNLMSVDDFDKALRLYSKAILVQVEADVDSSDRMAGTLTGELCRTLEEETRTPAWERKLHRIVNLLETAAFKHGFHLAAGLIGGECRLCDECVGPRSEEKCRHPFEARPSMEAMGIDVVRTCEAAGLPMALSSKNKVRWTGLILLE